MRAVFGALGLAVLAIAVFAAVWRIASALRGDADPCRGCPFADRCGECEGEEEHDE